MGDITEQIVEGACCAACYAPFEQDNGYPTICWDCWIDAEPDKDGFVGDAQRSVYPLLK